MCWTTYWPINQIVQSLIESMSQRSMKKEENYWPVSLTSHLYKSIESIINYLVEFLEGENFFAGEKHCFRLWDPVQQICSRHWRTELMLLMGVCVFLDYQKAFDTVPHQRLFTKLETLFIFFIYFNIGQDQAYRKLIAFQANG